MRILVLHSDVAADAPPDELDTLVAAEAIAAALMAKGHVAVQAAFTPDPQALAAQVEGFDLVFNLVESVYGSDALAAVAPVMLEALAMPYTGAGAAAAALAGDKPAAKRILRAAGLNTPPWAEPSGWDGLLEDVHYIVKSATADASLGLDAGAVVIGVNAVRARAEACAARFGGRWFAERYIEGREFNIALLDEGEGPVVLPPAEMCFTDWNRETPRIVGYAAKWDEGDADGAKMVRSFAVEADLARQLRDLSLRAWDLFGLKGYARVDLRVDEAGIPTILEVNPNPCLEPGAGFAAAAQQAGYDYESLIGRIAQVADHG